MHTQVILYSEQSNRTPRCSWEVSAAGLPWLKRFRVQCYTWVKSLLKCYLATRPGFCATNLLEVESHRVQSFVASLEALPSREEPGISLSIVNS